jgi:transcriptional regulator with XRE-family HTH domain
VKRSRAVPGREFWDGRRIREIREARGHSQAVLARLTGVGRADICRHERNDRNSNPSVAAVVRLAFGLNVPPATLLEPVGYRIPRPVPRSHPRQSRR